MPMKGEQQSEVTQWNSIFQIRNIHFASFLYDLIISLGDINRIIMYEKI